jgi:hypothetical protein
MTMFIARACLIASAAVCIMITDASAQQRREPEWVPLGCYEIRGGSQESGQIRVDIDTTRFSAIRLGAVGSIVRMIELNVTYPTGNSDTIPVEGIRIGSGNKSAPLDLPGNARELRQIQVIFQSSAVSPGRRTICAEGQVGGRRSAENWQELGCHVVDFNRDIDKFRVANDVGLIERVRLNVRDSDVRVMTFRVTYFGGNSEELVVDPPNIARDFRSRPIALKGGPQRIREIELLYFSIPNVNGKAVVCVEGLVIPGPPPSVPLPDITQLPAPEPGWMRFQCQTVDAAGDVMRVSIGREKGRFSAVQVQAFANNVRVDKLDVNLTNVQAGRRHWENFRILRDTTSNPMRFEDRPHRIDTIDVTYRAAEGPGGRAIVCINGRKAEDSSTTTPDNPPRQAAWRTIACQPVQSAREVDVYEVGRDDTNYSAIRFYAQNDDVNLRAVTIRYNNGASDRHVMSDNVIRRESRTNQYDLGDDRRVIERIELTYEASGNYGGRARLCIEGLPRPSRNGDGNRFIRQPIFDRR